MSEVVAEDRFPVVLSGAVEQRKARVVFTQPVDGVGRFVAWASPEVVVADTSFTVESSRFGNRAMDWIVDTQLGEVVVRSMGGCGCGDPLKNMIPWQPYRRGKPLR